MPLCRAACFMAGWCSVNCLPQWAALLNIQPDCFGLVYIVNQFKRLPQCGLWAAKGKGGELRQYKC